MSGFEKTDRFIVFIGNYLRLRRVCLRLLRELRLLRRTMLRTVLLAWLVTDLPTFPTRPRPLLTMRPVRLKAARLMLRPAAMMCSIGEYTRRKRPLDFPDLRVLRLDLAILLSYRISFKSIRPNRAFTLKLGRGPAVRSIMEEAFSIIRTFISSLTEAKNF